MPVEIDHLHITTYPDPILRKKTRPITDVNDEVRAVASRMIELMREAEGAGLAAPQIGLDWQLFVTAAREGGPPDRVFINPSIEVINRELRLREEGCLSVPGLHVNIRRPVSVRITALDEAGREYTLEDDDFDARVWQHEVDHLHGVLILDKMSPMDRLASRKLLKELRQSWQSSTHSASQQR